MLATMIAASNADFQRFCSKYVIPFLAKDRAVGNNEDAGVGGVEVGPTDPAIVNLENDLAKSGQGRKSSDEMIALYQHWLDTFPIVSIEDGLNENDWSVQDRSHGKINLIAVDESHHGILRWDLSRFAGKKVAVHGLAKAEDSFARAVRHRPRIRLTIRQRTRVLQQFPDRDDG
jgi:hypothetical protein